MNSTEFQRRLLIDPRAADMAAAAQARVCADAPALLAEALAMEERIDAALDVPIPADLVERVLAALPAESAPTPVRGFRRWWPLALAASVALVGWLSLALLRAPSATGALIAASVEHLAHEPYALTRSGRVPDSLVTRMFTEAGVRIDTEELALSYLNRCPLERRWSVHMVMPAPEGPVTVMYVIGEADIERMDTRKDMVAVRTLPFADGALVLLAESNRDFDRIESAWHRAAGDAEVLAAGSD
jgi:hypothetical protein